MLNRRILFAIAFFFLTVWVFQYFTHKNDNNGPGGSKVASGEVKKGQFYSAPVKQCWHREPQREIDFVDTTVLPEQEKTIQVQTPLYQMSFSNFGGILKSLSFKKHKGEKDKLLQTVSSDPIEQREEGAFLMALGEKTPYLYAFVGQERVNGTQSIIFKAKTEDWVIQKTYTLHDENYKIGVKLDFEPRKQDVKPLNVRLFFPAPDLDPGLPSDINKMSGVVTRDGVRIEKVTQSQELAGVWGLPVIFGGENKYFAHTLFKDPKSFAQGGYYKRVNRKLFAIVEGSPIKEKKSYNLSFYIGPKLLKDLSIVDPRLEDLLSFGWLSWICKLLLRLLEFLYSYIGNFGLAIILLTILLKLPFMPLSISSRKKMEEYQKYQPTIQRIRAKYKNDLKKQQEEIMIFHKQHNLSPATPMVGCLPLLIQLPILFSLYRVLGSYLSLYHAPFFGWLQDLSAKDPYYILPIMMGVTMIWQQRMSPVGDDKQRMMMMFMPILMTAIFLNFPAGLVLYWFVNNLLTALEDVLRKKVFS